MGAIVSGHIDWQENVKKKKNVSFYNVKSTTLRFFFCLFCFLTV